MKKGTMKKMSVKMSMMGMVRGYGNRDDEEHG